MGAGPRPVGSAPEQRIIMPASPADSAEVGVVMMMVEGALAKAQGELGVICRKRGPFLHRASFELQIEPAGLAAATRTNGVPVTAVIAAFRKAARSPRTHRLAALGCDRSGYYGYCFGAAAEAGGEPVGGSVKRADWRFGPNGGGACRPAGGWARLWAGSNTQQFRGAGASWGQLLLRHRGKMTGGVVHRMADSAAALRTYRASAAAGLRTGGPDQPRCRRDGASWRRMAG